MLLLKVSWWLLSPSDPSLLKLRATALCWGSLDNLTSYHRWGTPGPHLHHFNNLIIFKNHKQKGREGKKKKKHSLFSKKRKEQCYFIHLWDFVLYLMLSYIWLFPNTSLFFTQDLTLAEFKNFAHSLKISRCLAACSSLKCRIKKCHSCPVCLHWSPL